MGFDFPMGVKANLNLALKECLLDNVCASLSPIAGGSVAERCIRLMTSGSRISIVDCDGEEESKSCIGVAKFKLGRGAGGRKRGAPK